jgi:hypothetical protein
MIPMLFFLFICGSYSQMDQFPLNFEQHAVLMMVYDALGS